jgi:hypothetical protein
MTPQLRKQPDECSEMCHKIRYFSGYALPRFCTFTGILISIFPVAKKSLKKEENSPASDIPVLLKIDSYFIAKKNIRSVVRFGKGCKIILITGDELLIRVNYNKVVEIVG